MLRGNPGSPNYCWQKAGYRIEREPRKNHGTLRKIFDPDGVQILCDAGYEAEMAEIKRRGLYKTEQLGEVKG